MLENVKGTRRSPSGSGSRRVWVAAPGATWRSEDTFHNVSLPFFDLSILVVYLSSIYNMKAQNAFSVAGTSALLLAASVSAEVAFQVSRCKRIALSSTFFELPSLGVLEALTR